MKNTKWSKFSALTGKCYDNMIGVDKDGSCWMKTFELMKEIVLEERQINANFAPLLEMLDDVTDYEYDISGWLEDCMDELDMRGEHDNVLYICNVLLDLFDWPDYTDSDIKFSKTIAMRALNRKEEAEKYCREWIQEEPENIVAATAGIYAFIETKEYDKAEKLVGKFIIDSRTCTDDNDIIFTAASKLYEVTGNKNKKRQIDKAIKEYDDSLAFLYEGGAFEDDFDLFDGELPFD